MVGALQSIWRLMTGEVIQSTETKIHNGQTKIVLALRRAKDGALFVSLKQASAGNTQWSSFEPGEFDQFVRAAGRICDALATEREKISN
jgi:hypothetical protein